jgi:hypothetical protein
VAAIKTRPEFQGLTPADIVKGREQLKNSEKTMATSAKDYGADTTKKKVVEETKKQSLFDRTRRIGKYQDISLELKSFGYEFFQEAAVKVLTEREDIPIPMKYVIGPGDEVKILMWGRTNAKYDLPVDRDGKITIPQIGPVIVAGMTYEQIQAGNEGEGSGQGNRRSPERILF